MSSGPERSQRPGPELIATLPTAAARHPGGGTTWEREQMITTDGTGPVAVLTRVDAGQQTELRLYADHRTLTIERLADGEIDGVRQLTHQDPAHCAAAMRDLLAEFEAAGFAAPAPTGPVRTGGADAPAREPQDRTDGASGGGEVRTDGAGSTPEASGTAAAGPAEDAGAEDVDAAVRAFVARMLAAARAGDGPADRFAAAVRLQQALDAASHQAYVAAATEADALARDLGNNGEAARALTELGYRYGESGVRKLRDVARAARAGANSHQP